jgi:hypothetical protein
VRILPDAAKGTSGFLPGGAIVAAQSTGSKPAQAPIFEVDPFWP